MLDVAGRAISVDGSGNLSVGGGLLADANGWTRDGAVPGFLGWKDGAISNNLQYSPTNGPWPIDFTQWNLGMSGGVFTAPIAGEYLCSAQGIFNGGSGYPSGQSTYSYFGFSRNLGVPAFMHVNVSALNPWEQGGICQMIHCEVGDTIRFHCGTAPVPTGTGENVTNNYGMYPYGLHAIWVMHMG